MTTLAVDRAALYSGTINLWVEDEITRAYLSQLWNDPNVRFLIGGGREGVSAILVDAAAAGYNNVFGVVDRDFGRSNYANWQTPGGTFRRFVLRRHEIENYLLDTPALHGCRFNNHGLTETDIDEILDAEVARRCWWSACRSVIALIRERFHGNFMAHPTTPPVDSELEAIKHIVDSDWFGKLPRRTDKTTEARVRKLLRRMHGRAQQMRHDGRWREEFSGKEFFRVIGNRIFNRAAAGPNYRPSPAEFDIDLAKSIALWQTANNSVPRDLEMLLRALRARIAAV
jgi:hypothetical protein